MKHVSVSEKQLPLLSVQANMQSSRSRKNDGRRLRSRTPLVSIVIPTNYKIKSMIACLSACRAQTYRALECIVVSPKDSHVLRTVIARYGAKLVINTEGKTASRNAGARAAKGTYLVHLDDDMRPDPHVIEECVKVAKQKKLQALVIPEVVMATGSFMNSIRVFEKQMMNRDMSVVSPRFVDAGVYAALGGMDERLDPIDEGDFKEKLVKHHIRYASISHPILLDISNTTAYFFERIVHMYSQGTKAALFRAIHPEAQQFTLTKRMYLAQYLLTHFIDAPLTVLGVIAVKACDLVALKLGMLKGTDIKLSMDVANTRVFEQEAKVYQQNFFENSRGSKYVNYQEQAIVKSYLADLDPEKQYRFLDIGAGGGRWSQLLLNAFPRASVVAFDRSHGMVENLRSKFRSYGKRFSVVEGDMQNLPFSGSTFDAVVSVRVIKYASDQEQVYSEIRRVLKRNGTAVLEIPYPNSIVRLLQHMPIRSSLVSYAKRIVIHSNKAVAVMFQRLGLTMTRQGIYFTVPATLYKEVNNPMLLRIVQGIDQLLPKSLFGRSMFMQCKKRYL